MLNKNSVNKSIQIEMISVEQMVPSNHLLRKIDAAIDFSFIYDLVEDLYCLDNGRPSIDPVILLKIVLLQYLYGIKSMRQTIREIEVNIAYRWFLGLGFGDSVPHFTTFSQNYRRRFSGTDLFDQIFQHILLQAYEHGLVDSKIQFIDSTHVKAHANRHKNEKVLVAKKSKVYQRRLEKEINEEREEHNKKPFDPPKNPPKEEQEKTVSTTDPESGLFHKGEHKEVFAYMVQTSCDKHGWILAYNCYPGNEHDSVTFDDFYKEKIKPMKPKKLVMDAGYKTPNIARELNEDGVQAVFPYVRPKRSPSRENGYYNRDYVYVKEFDCFVCPEYETLTYSTTYRNGYNIYKSKKDICKTCPKFERCISEGQKEKILSRHIWKKYLEDCDAYRKTRLGKIEYQRRKETIERVFGTAKEHHGFRYTNMIGRAKMQMKAALTYTCLNLKKLANYSNQKRKTGSRNGLKKGLFSLIF